MGYNNVRDRYIKDGAGVVPPARLLVMLYDRLILDLEQADAALANRALSVVHDKLVHAQSIILELQSALNVDAWEGAANLAELYRWFNQELVNANIKKDVTPIRSVLPMIRDLAESWRAACDEVLSNQTSAAQPPTATIATIPTHR